MNIFLWFMAGSLLYRWRGHSSKYKKFFPRPFNQIAFALPYAYIAYDSGWFFALLTLILTTLAVLSGHGKFMDLGTTQRMADDESLEFLIKPLENKIPVYWYDALGLAITGLAVSLPAGIFTLNPILAFSGALKAPAYIISHKLGWGTEGGEWITGGFLWGSLSLFI